MTQLYPNNARSVLNGDITIGATTLAVTPGTGADFPSPANGHYFLLTLASVSGNGEDAWEIVKVTGRSTDTLTIVRAQEGTTAQAWTSGTIVEARLTGGTLDKFGDLGSTSHNPSSGGTISRESRRTIITSSGQGAITLTLGADSTQNWQAGDFIELIIGGTSGIKTINRAGTGVITLPDGTTDTSITVDATTNGIVMLYNAAGDDNWELVQQ